MSTEKRKMQNVSFKNVEEFLSFLPQDELEIVLVIRKIIFNLAPSITEKLSYNVPFFRLHKNILFIWPASILWGEKKSYTGVRIGFTNGYLLRDAFPYLSKGDRKYVYYKDFQKLSEIDTDLLKSYIIDAIELDNNFHKTKNGLQRKISR